MNPKDIGLRQRKHQETRHCLEKAAIELVSKNGLEHTTVEAISELANVSKRTFFNYFNSKEDAVLGSHDFGVTEEILSEHAEQYKDSDVIESVVGLLFKIFGPIISDPELHESRKQIIKKYPQLIERQITRFSGISKQLIAAIQGILRSRNSDASKAEAEILFAICATSARSVLCEWATAGKEEPITKLEIRAVKLIREALSKINV